MTAWAVQAFQGLHARTSEPLLWLAGGGVEKRTDTRYYHNAQQRREPSHVTLQLTIAGEGFYRDASGYHVLPANHAWMNIIPGRFEYGFHPASPRPLELVFVSMVGPVAMRWHQRLTAAFGHILDFGPRNPIQAQMLAIAHMRQSGTLPDRYLLSAMLYQLLMTIYSTLRGSRVSTNPRVARAIELIAEHASDHRFGVDTLARMVDCTREYLSRQFRVTTGVSPSEYLTQHRLRTAARLIRETDAKLDQIARQAGFSGANYLCRVFRQRLGITPAQMRASPWLAV